MASLRADLEAPEEGTEVPKIARTTRGLVVAVMAVLLAALVVPAFAAPAYAAGPSADRTASAGYGAGWVARQFNSQGFVGSASDASKPDLNLTAEAVLALASARVGATQAGAALDYLAAHVDDYVKTADGDRPAALATLILDAIALGRDPTAFGGQDLVARLSATETTSGADEGLFGAQDPTYDGAFRQGLALLALSAVGKSDQPAINWLVSQQCISGGWAAYRADASVPCPAPDPVNFTGPDTNSTAIAVEALVAQHTQPKADAIAFLAQAQSTDGGWAFIGGPGQPSDADSTSLVIQALIASGVAPSDPRFAKGSRDPYDVLLSFQLGCGAAVADRGAFGFQADAKGRLTPNALATVQAVPAAAGVAFPLSRTVLADEVPTMVCAAAATTTVITARPTTTAVRSSVVTLPATGAGADPRGATSVALILIALGMLAIVRTRREPTD